MTIVEISKFIYFWIFYEIRLLLSVIFFYFSCARSAHTCILVNYRILGILEIPVQRGCSIHHKFHFIGIHDHFSRINKQTFSFFLAKIITLGNHNEGIFMVLPLYLLSMITVKSLTSFLYISPLWYKCISSFAMTIDLFEVRAPGLFFNNGKINAIVHCWIAYWCRPWL